MGLPSMPLQTKLPRKELFEAPLTKSIDSPYKGLSQSPRRELEFELIPRCMHHKNVRAVVPRDIWALLRHICLRFDGAKCGECSSTENLECHEVWEYRTEPVRVMKLAKLRILCHLCHLGKHIGFAGICGEYLEVEAQQLTLYSLSKMQLASHRRIAYKKARELDQGGMFELDLTYLNDERFLWVHHRFRKFAENELENCRKPSPGKRRHIPRRLN
jgi:hypothetical protein